MSPEAERLAALEDLMLLRVPVGSAIARLRAFPWDSDSPLVVLTRQHVQALLGAYLEGRLDEHDCESWAAALECRDDVGLEPGFEQPLKAFLFEVATPELAGRLTPPAAGRWSSQLNSPGRG
jgi:hypothetical protein